MFPEDVNDVDEDPEEGEETSLYVDVEKSQVKDINADVHKDEGVNEE